MTDKQIPQTDVDLRDYVERIIRDHQIAHDQRHAADQEAIAQQRENLSQQREEDREALRLAREGFDKQLGALEDKLNKRLDVVNGFRSEWMRERDRYLPRETYEAGHDPVVRRLNELEAIANRADGKYLSQFSFQEKLNEWSDWRTKTDRELGGTIDRKTFDDYKGEEATRRRNLLVGIGMVALGAFINLIVNIVQNNVP